MKRIREKLDRFFQNRYGIDELGKALLWFGAVFYIIGIISKKLLFSNLSLFVLIYAIYRTMSRDHWNRADENKKFIQYVKLWKIRWRERKNSRIYMCKKCGKMIRVPKGRGKIQITCPQCGSKIVKRT